MKKIYSVFFLTSIILSGFLLSGYVYLPQEDTMWSAPKYADTLVNPFANNMDNAIGKKLFNKLCWSCHGKLGKGDGPAGVNLDPKPSNFTDKKILIQKDGALFWKINNGKGTMAPYQKSLSKEDRWHLVSYIRTFSN